jgi:hypothetical protein
MTGLHCPLGTNAGRIQALIVNCVTACLLCNSAPRKNHLACHGILCMCMATQHAWMQSHTSAPWGHSCRYVISTPAARNGTECPAKNGDTRADSPCTNFKACKPVACNATWVTTGPCNGPCNNGVGTKQETYVIYAPPVDNGAACTNPNGTNRWVWGSAFACTCACATPACTYL